MDEIIKEEIEMAEIVSAAADAEQERQEELARTLVPYSDNLPYDRLRVIQEIRMCMAMDIQFRFEIGRRLILLRENEGDAKTFSHILGEHFAGLKRKTAENYMRFARIAATLPKFQAWASGKDNWSKALTIMQAVEEEDLQEFDESGSVLGLAVDDLDKMSVRELKGKIKKLEREKKEVVLEAIEKTLEENIKLREKIEVFELAQEEPGLKAAQALIAKADRMIHEALQILRKVDWAVVGNNWNAKIDAMQKLDLINRMMGSVEFEIHKFEPEPEADGSDG